MKQKTDKIKNLKRAGTIIAIAGSLALGSVSISRTTKDDSTDPTENKEYIKHLEHVADEMTHEQKLQFIHDGKEVLNNLQQKIDSDETNPEERFEALRSKRLVNKEIEVMQKKLNNGR